MELLLPKYSIYDNWIHVITGLCSGFIVRIQEELSHTYIFHQPQILPIISQFHKYIHSRWASRWSLLQRFFAGGAWAVDWSLSHFTPRPYAKAKFKCLLDDPGHVLPPQPPGCTFHESQHQPWWLPHHMGHLQHHIFPHSLLTIGCISATFDRSTASPVLPDHQQHLCVIWDGPICIDCIVMFGLSSSASVFGYIADMLVTIYKAVGIQSLLKWANNFFIICLPHQSWSLAGVQPSGTPSASVEPPSTLLMVPFH